jgi:acyl transferase domain-containing protein/thioesterase domain-containing protein
MLKESIAIIGMGCRFPGASNLSEFWEIIHDGVDTITEAPKDRPTEMKGLGGFLQGIDEFDAAFFGIAPEEAIKIDPQHRLLLEVTWEALENAGLIPANLAGKNAGVFVGLSSDGEYLNLSIEDPTFNVTLGTLECMLANRISSYFDCRGLSLTINTACSSALVAIDRACHSLWNEEISLALVGGTHLTFSPVITSRFANAGMLSEDGRCKTFDAQADGYVRGEGIGVVVLKLLSQAQADGDRIYAVIRGSGINHNGSGNGLISPNMQAQIDLLQRVYQQANIDPSSTNYIEAHGTATLIGDALEMKALGAVVGKNRTPDNPCRVGCVKTNIGHTEGASGIAGLIKVALSLYHRQIPPNLHFQEPNPAIPFAKLGLKVQESLETLPKELEPIRAGVSAFGLGGTNAHVLLESVPPQAKAEPNLLPLQIFTLSAKSPTALQSLAQRYQAFLEDKPEASLVDICFTANTRRSQFKHRLAIITESKEQLSNQLNIYLEKESLSSIFSGQITRRKPAPICFIFSGKSQQIKPIIKSFYKSQPTLNSLLEPLELILKSHLDKSFLELIAAEKLENPLHSQLVDFLCEYAIAQLWRFWGIKPAIFIGYGAGNYTALVLAEILTLEDTISLILKKKDLTSTQNFQPAKIPVVSSVTGNTIQINQIIDFEQWQKEFDFANSNLKHLPDSLSDDSQILLDICSIHIKNNDIEAIDYYDIKSDNLYFLFSTLIKFWLMGVKIDWSKVEDYKQCYPISLPTYPFERQSYWINVSSTVVNKESENQITNNQNKLEQLDQEFVAPRDELEQQLANIWQKVLGHKSIGIHDNFFALGGNSRLSALLVSEIEKTLNKHFSLASFFQFPTIAEISQSISEPLTDLTKSKFTTKLAPKDYQKLLTNVLGRNGLRPSKNSLMVSLSSQKNKKSFFFCANAIHEAYPLNKYLGKEYSFYFLESGYIIFVKENRITEENIKAIALHHLQDILTIQPEGEYFLAGYSFGSLVAYEIAKQLEEKGKKVAFLGILDMYRNNPRLNHFLVLNIRMKNLTKLIITRNFGQIVTKFQKIVNSFTLKLQIKLKILTDLVIQKEIDKTDNSIDSIPDSMYILDNTLKQYKMDGYHGKITLFLAEERIKSNPVEKLIFLLFHGYGWTRESLSQIYKVSGNHHSMIQEPHVKLLAEKLTACIDKALRDSEI